MNQLDSTPRVGVVVQVIGPVVDVTFKGMSLPEIYTAIRITSEGFDTPIPVDIIVEVEQHLGEDTVRCVSMHPTDGLSRGMKAFDIGGPIMVPVGIEVLGRVMNVIGEPVDHMGPIRRQNATRSTASRPRSRSRTPSWRCSRPGSRSSTSSSPSSRAARSGCSAAPASARPSSSRSSSTTWP